MQAVTEFYIEDINEFKEKTVQWIKGFEVFCILDSNVKSNPDHFFGYRDYDLVIAAGVESEIISSTENLTALDTIYDKKGKWNFGFLSYDLKNSFENLYSKNADYLGWPDFYFFSPQILILIRDNKAFISSSQQSEEEVLNDIHNTDPIHLSSYEPAHVSPRISKQDYIDKVEKLRQHIRRGDIYEVNFCQEFYTSAQIDPYSFYFNLNSLSPTPFSSFFRLREKYLISASPERFIKKEENKIISQPIKGTAPRGRTTNDDLNIKAGLQKNLKERAENIMIVDLVRNDLSKIALQGTVKADELCGIYSFSHVHQMISTISATLNTSSLEKIFRATFPMGSMTGAPKIRAMELAEQYETTKRGLYSGAVGYITPDKNFDFNVVIRSLQYNQHINYLSYMVGGAITWLSDAGKEYEECLLKASAMDKLLKGL